MLNKKSEIVFIGAGKVAHTLVPLLIKKGFSVKGIVSRRKDPATFLGKKYRLDFYASVISKIPVNQGIFFITVPDGQIPDVDGKLASLGLDFKKSLFIHTSGSETSSALKNLQKKGGITASFHIMQTFPSLKPTDIRNSFAAIETKSRAAEKFLFDLAMTMDLKSFRITEEEKVFYHLAGVFTANFLNSNFSAAEKLLNNTAIGEGQHFNLFEPIITTTLSNIKNYGVAESLSGPVQRGDFLTIKKHIDALKKSKVNDGMLILRSYISQSLILLDIIKRKRKKLTADQVKVKKILEVELKKI